MVHMVIKMDEVQGGDGTQDALSAFDRVLSAVSRVRQELQQSVDTNILSSTRQLFRRSRSEGKIQQKKHGSHSAV